MKDLNINVNLKCYVCGNDDFSTVDEEIYDMLEASDDTEVKCSDCGRIVTKGQLIEDNSHIIEANVEDLKKEAIKEIQKDLKKVFKKWK